MDAAGIVSDHSADGAAVVTGRIGREREVMFFSGVTQLVENHAGLHAGDAAHRIDFENSRHVLGKIEDHGDVAALAGKRGAAAATEQRRSEFAADGNRGQNIIGIVGKNNSDGNLAVIRPVGRIEGAASVVEANVVASFARQSCSQSFGQPRSVSSCGLPDRLRTCSSVLHGADFLVG